VAVKKLTAKPQWLEESTRPREGMDWLLPAGFAMLLFPQI
jgi:hypothetical protein